jgi:hypothetical protein
MELNSDKMLGLKDSILKISDIPTKELYSQEIPKK